MVKRHQKPQGDQPGQILEKEASLHISNVSLWNKDEDRRVKVGFERVEIDGKSKKVRVDRVNSARLDA
jgi:large subunit ribosomal protein L24